MKTILLIDSDVQRRNLYARILTRRGYAVIHADNGDDAQRAAGSQQVDLCVLDSELEDTSGEGFLEVAGSALAGAKVVYLSTFFQRDSRLYHRLMEELCVSLVLHKPIAPLEFGVQIDHLLDADAADTLEQDSTVETQLAQMRSGFVDTLADELEQLSAHVRRARRAQYDPDQHDPDQLHDVRRVARRIQSAASRHGYFEIGQSASALEQALDRLETGEPPERDAAWIDIDTALRNARASSLHLQSGRGNPAPDRPGDSAPPQTTKVLLVDDDQLFVDKATELGEQLLIEICQATTATRALELFDEHAAHLEAVFINVDMREDFDAWELVQKLRERPRHQPIPIAFISEAGHITDRVQAAHAGAALFLDKPVDSTEFSQAVHQLVSRERAGRPTVLLVDEDAEFVASARRLFEQAQMTVADLDDSTDVLEQLERTNPDAVVMDAFLSGISGFDLCRMLRTIPRWQDLPIIFVSDRGGIDIRVAAYRAGADDFVTRPANPDELLARLRVRISRARLMRQRADRDLLTGLLTRRAFLEAVAARISEVRRKDQPLAFCLLDLDHFKQINDTHGHIAGDRVLAGLGHLLQSRFRFEDLRGRWGGEEFAIAIVGEDAATAERVLERIQREFERIAFEGSDGATFNVTFSAGIAQFPDDGVEADQLLKTADRRLYAAKDGGRNLILSVDQQHPN